MSEREVLVNNIQKHFMLNDSLGDFGNRTYQFTVNEIADFVLADRKRICAPLLELKETAKRYCHKGCSSISRAFQR